MMVRWWVFLAGLLDFIKRASILYIIGVLFGYREGLLIDITRNNLNG